MKILFSIGLFWMALMAQAQVGTGLQFNQVKIVTAQETVPTGKVWKVESVIFSIAQDESGLAASGSANCGSSYYYRRASININGVTTKIGNGSQAIGYSNNDFFHSYTLLPVWLPAGATLSGGVCNNQISVIEFNVLP